MPKRFLWLDAMRGVAAISVVFLHALDAFSIDRDWLPQAGLAVDFFFALSGFVIAHAYDKRIAGGLSTGRFIRSRLIRLYPLIVLGLLTGFAVYAIKIVTQHRPDLWVSMLGSTGLNALLLPSPWLTVEDHGTGWPINLPLWSLSFEFAINVLYVVLLVRLSVVRLTAVAGLGLVLLAWQAWHAGGIGGGPSWDSMGYGLIRVLYPFTAGLLLARLYRASAPSARTRISMPPHVLGVLCAVTLVGIFMAPVPSMMAGTYQWAVVALAFPALVWLAAHADAKTSPGHVHGMLERLGAWSYPLYVLHYPLIKAGSNTMRRLGIDAAHPAFWVCIAAEVLASLALAAIALHWYDMPVRAWLGQRFNRKARLAHT
jgi:peptidoglycan/LPS O-acetylase OafA/YrhL